MQCVRKMVTALALGGNDGSNPSAGLRSNGSGGLYGTTLFGGGSSACGGGCGTVFELTQTGGVWSEALIHNCNYSDGFEPTPVITDTSGNLYGGAAFGGSSGHGTVWEITP